MPMLDQNSKIGRKFFHAITSTWFYPKNEQITIEYEHEQKITIDLPQAGIFTLSEGCKASTQYTKFRAHQVIEATLQTKIFPECSDKLIKNI